MHTNGTTRDGLARNGEGADAPPAGSLAALAASSAEPLKGPRPLLIGMAKYKLRALISFVALVVLVVYWASLVKPAYVSEAVVLVRPSTADLLSENPGPMIGGASSANSNVRQYVAIQMKLLTSADVQRRLATSLINRYGTPEEPDEPDEPSLWESTLLALGMQPQMPVALEGFEAPDPAIASVLGLLREIVTVENVFDSPLITLTCQHEDPFWAARILEHLLVAYREARDDLYALNDAESAAEKEHTTQIHELEKTQKALADFCTKHQVNNPADSLALVTARLDGLLDERRSAELRRIESSITAEMLTKVLGGMDPQLPASTATNVNPVRGVLQTRLDELRIKRFETQATPGSLAHKAVLESIGYVEQRLKDEPRTYTTTSEGRQNTAHTQIQASLRTAEIASSAAEQLEAELKARIEPLEQEAARLAPLGSRYAALQEVIAERQVRADSTRLWRDRFLQERAFSEAQTMSTQRVIQKPTIATAPEGSGPMKRLMLGTLLAALAAVALAYVSGLGDQTVREPGELHGVGLDAVAFVPDVGHRKNLLKFERRYGADQPRGDGAVPRVLGRPDLCTGALTNQLDRLARAVRDQRGEQDKTAEIVLCGARSGDGVTTIALSLARRLSANDQNRVLLVDWNSASPCASGLASEDAQQDEVVRPTAIPGLDVADAALHAQPNGLHKRMIDEVRANYDYVVYDGGVVTSSGEALDLLERDVAVALVVRADRTPMPVVREGVEVIRRTPATLLGTILNGVTYYFPTFAYTGV